MSCAYIKNFKLCGEQMSVTNIPDKIKMLLWGKSAGRCNYCNTPLWKDDLTKVEFNTSYIAHIIADQPGGPRGDSVLSERLQSDISNLMLMCDVHHRLIDKEEVEKHTVDLLTKMKENHEKRIEFLSSLKDNKKSHIIKYCSNVGCHRGNINFLSAASAIAQENYYPAESRPIEIGLSNSSFKDHEKAFWNLELENLHRQFNDKVKPLIHSGEINHISGFAFAPQPLLIKFGELISDITAAEIYQLHREPSTWNWQKDPDNFEYRIIEPQEYKKTVALNLSLSATIDNSRIFKVLGNDISIWTISIDKPYNDFLQGREQLEKFRKIYRHLLDKIKIKHGQDALLNIFPACPVAVAVEIGRVRQPKADLKYKIYDQNEESFIEAF